MPDWIRFFRIEPTEWKALLAAFFFFFSLLSGYYVLRSLREALIAADGTRLIPTVFTSVFFCMLLITPVYGLIVSHFERRHFLPIVFGAVVSFLVFFSFAFRSPAPDPAVTTGFAIFLSVMNLFTVSVFWSFMSDIFNHEQAKRLFGAIGAGGTLGAMCGPLITKVLVADLGIPNLFLLSAALYGLCIGFIFLLIPWARKKERAELGDDKEKAIGGSIVGGAKLVFSQPLLIALVLHMFFGVSMGTLLYNQQAAVVGALGLSAPERAEYFAELDLATNVLCLVVQLLLTRYLLPRFGVGPLLVAQALFMVFGLGALAAVHSALVLSMVQVGTRGLAFGLLQPARESIFTQLDREVRYKGKNFIDTVIYRGGDMATAWAYQGLVALGLGLSALTSCWVIVALLWLAVACWIMKALKTIQARNATSADTKEVSE